MSKTATDGWRSDVSEDAVERHGSLLASRIGLTLARGETPSREAREEFQREVRPGLPESDPEIAKQERLWALALPELEVMAAAKPGEVRWTLAETRLERVRPTDVFEAELAARQPRAHLATAQHKIGPWRARVEREEMNAVDLGYDPDAEAKHETEIGKRLRFARDGLREAEQELDLWSEKLTEADARVEELRNEWMTRSRSLADVILTDERV